MRHRFTSILFLFCCSLAFAAAAVSRHSVSLLNCSSPPPPSPPLCHTDARRFVVNPVFHGTLSRYSDEWFVALRPLTPPPSLPLPPHYCTMKWLNIESAKQLIVFRTRERQVQLIEIIIKLVRYPTIEYNNNHHRRRASKQIRFAILREGKYDLGARAWAWMSSTIELKRVYI